MKKCTYCGHENADEAQFCSSCATPFALDELRAEQTAGIATAAPRTAAERDLIRGIVWCAGGLLVTVASYVAAGPGGTYYITFGAIVYGLVCIWLGLRGKKAEPGEQSAAYDTLEAATRLESQGRIDEALRAYQLVVEKFPGTDAARDAKVSIDNLEAARG